MTRVSTQPGLLEWARDRAGRSLESLAKQFPKLPEWEQGSARPTLKQLESFARAVHVPVGYLMLPEPPAEQVPIPDLRTPGSRPAARPSPDLLDAIYLCQRRQAWYRDWAQSTAEDERAFVGSARLTSAVEETAAAIRRALGFDLEARRECPTWTDALRLFIGQAEDLGALVMVSGVVGSNNHRKLDPAEFRGFALADRLAPLVFVNGADTKAAQMFTLAHELAHLWLGESALTNTSPSESPTHGIEAWCNRVAAEMLVPLAELRRVATGADPIAQVTALARRFKVSSLVVIRRLFDAGLLGRETFERAYDAELVRLLAMPKSSGGDFYLAQPVRLSRRFTRALIGSTLEGQTLYRDAFKMLGISKEATFRELGASVGYA
jgi:Zn-dependent peptidase ImmA (M78 family)